MAWISFVIVALVFYAPLIGLSRLILEQALPLDIALLRFSLSVPPPYSDYLRTFLYSLGLWLALWGLLYALDRLGKTDLLRQVGLRNSLFYATRPYLSNQLAVILAGIILFYLVAWAVLPLIARLISPESLLLASLLPPPDWGLVILSALTVMVDYGYRLEQRWHYDMEIQRNQHERKETQKEMVVH